MPALGLSIAQPFGPRKQAPSGPPTMPGDALLLESSSYLLLEDGSKLLLG